MEITMEDLLKRLDESFNENEDVTSLNVCEKYFAGDHEKAVGMLKSITGKEYIEMHLKEETQWQLTQEGLLYSKEGSPEYLTWKYIYNKEQEGEKITLEKVKDVMGSVGISIGLKNGWVKFEGEEKYIKCTKMDINDECKEQLIIIHTHNQSNIHTHLNMTQKDTQTLLQTLKRRKLISHKKLKFYQIHKTNNFKLEVKQNANDLTSEMLADGTWKDYYFKPYNFFAAGKRHNIGTIHPLTQMLVKFKKVFISLGFEEMPTDRWVESSFWNFDSLFMPQQHPARDSQDTFFIEEPKHAQFDTYKNTYAQYIDNVHTVHEKGGYGSLGWKSEWSFDEAMKNILRTHTTGISTQMLYKLCQQYKKTGVFEEKRLFSIDRVFRNETLDATHLAEFHQVEGMVAMKGMSLASLMSVMKTFYKKCGIPYVKFKPAFNPYTEPSMEIFGYHPILEKWIEVGNSGVFRPEVTHTMGIPEDVTVIAWGLSLERPTMIRYGISNMRDLFGAKASLTLPLAT